MDFLLDVSFNKSIPIIMLYIYMLSRGIIEHLIWESPGWDLDEGKYHLFRLVESFTVFIIVTYTVGFFAVVGHWFMSLFVYYRAQALHNVFNPSGDYKIFGITIRYSWILRAVYESLILITGVLLIIYI